MGYFRVNIEQTEGYVPGFQPSDVDVVKLNTNENPYPPSKKVIEALKNIDGETLRRYPQPCGDSFRRAAGEVLGISEENIICTNGGDDLLTICFRAFCDENRPTAYPVPTYSLYPVLAKLQNCDVIEIPFDDEFNLPGKLVSTGAAMTIVCNPNAPSGTGICVEELASLASEIEGVLVIDEAYVDFAEQNCVGLVKDFDNVIILRSMSKGYSLAGLRFGYGVADEKLIAGLMKVKDSYNVDTVAIRAATAAIQDQEYFKGNVEKTKNQRQRLTEELTELGFYVYPSQSNFVLAKCDKVKIKAISIYEKLKNKNLYVRYWAYPELQDKLRITVGTAEQNNILLSELRNIL